MNIPTPAFTLPALKEEAGCIRHKSDQGEYSVRRDPEAAKFAGTFLLKRKGDREQQMKCGLARGYDGYEKLTTKILKLQKRKLSKPYSCNFEMSSGQRTIPQRAWKL
ncbi:hypothetical protein KM043_013704 [Ampulex compressa]|nr:hypothetical protein KM043_013704 [Ampulex compressa]